LLTHFFGDCIHKSGDILIPASCLGDSLNTLSLAYPHRKKSSGSRSGEQVAHGFSVLLETTQSSNMP